MSDSQDYGPVMDEIARLILVHGFPGLLFGLKAYAESQAEGETDPEAVALLESIAQQLDGAWVDAQSLEGM